MKFYVISVFIVFIIALSLLFNAGYILHSAPSQQDNTCDKGGEFKVKIIRAIKQNEHCIDLVAVAPSIQGNMWPSSRVDLLSDLGDGVGFAASLNVDFFDEPDGSRVALSNFCLSEKVLKSSKLMFEYTAPDPNGYISLCFEKYEVNHLDELLAQSEKEKVAAQKR